MPYELTVDHEEDYIRITVIGELSIEDIEGIIEKTLVIRQKHGIKQILSDHRSVTALPSIINLYKLGETLANELFYGVRLAVIGGALHESEKFTETVAANRGVNVRIFKEEQAARKWLGIEDKN